MMQSDEARKRAEEILVETRWGIGSTQMTDLVDAMLRFADERLRLAEGELEGKALNYPMPHGSYCATYAMHAYRTSAKIVRSFRTDAPCGECGAVGGKSTPPPPPEKPHCSCYTHDPQGIRGFPHFSDCPLWKKPETREQRLERALRSIARGHVPCVTDEVMDFAERALQEHGSMSEGEA